jgi:catechol 2,3-dioxygenase-like lactoylglutathione lyase family enzyme
MTGFAENRRVATVAVVVSDYDEAVAWYVEKLGFALAEDVDLGGGKRWVVVAPPGGQGARLLLAEASDVEQASRIGNQTGGRVFLFLETEDFARDHAAMLEMASRSAAASKPMARWRFADLHGNLWDLIEPKR